MSVNESTSEKDHSKCVEMFTTALTSNNTVKKLVDEIRELGCTMPSGFFKCMNCEGKVSGGFLVASSPTNLTSSSSATEVNATLPINPQIILCENKQLGKKTFENTIIHELVHALDNCRAKIDWTNCYHLACSEVRASSISGECSYLQESMRGKGKLRGGLQTCVKRRAEGSVALNPHCKGISHQAVDAVFTECFNDITPFEYPPT